MALPIRYCPSCLSATSFRSALLPASNAVQIRTAVNSANAAKYKRKDQPTSARKKKSRTSYLQPDLKDAIQFPLVDAMR